MVGDFESCPEIQPGSELVIGEKELTGALENLPENPYRAALWADEHGEVVLAVFGNSLKFKKREDARHVFALIERLFDSTKTEEWTNEN